MKPEDVLGHSDASITASCLKDLSSSLALNVTIEPGLRCQLDNVFLFHLIISKANSIKK